MAADEVSVPVVIANTGSESWDPARVHLSYHWLWLVPREIASRSRWNVPYEDGIRTGIGQPISSGGRVAVQGRILPPSWPGLYWLQWDMVEEGVAWFDQVSPRQSRSLVVVVPQAAWAFAPLPIVLAIVGPVAFGPAADLIWCATTLASKPLLVIHDALLEPTPFAYWLIVAVAILPSLVAFVVLRGGFRAWVLVAVGILGSLVALGDIVYYRFFGDVLSAPALLAAGQTGHVLATIRSLFSWSLVWVVIDLPLAVWLALRLSRSVPSSTIPFARRMVVSVAVLAPVLGAGALLSAHGARMAAELEQVFRNRAIVEELGVFGYHAYDAWNYVRSKWLREPATSEQVEDARSWFTARAGLRAGRAPSFGVARGRNLIVIQVESLQDFAVDYTVASQEVMPFLRRWKSDAVRFTNVTDETNQGRTSDAEFASMTSLLPLDQGAVAFRFPGNHYVAMPRVLHDHGYATLSAVAFESGFWNRLVMHPSYGFEHSLFEPDFELTDQVGWGLNDREFLRQMVPHLERMQRPFAAWLITLSLHHPFDDFPDRHKTLRLGSLDHTSFGNYLHAMRFADRAIGEFVATLERDGLLETSVVVVFGDHDAGFSRDETLAKLIGIAAAEAAWTLNDRIPWFIRVPGPDGRQLAGERALPAGQTDFAPTIMGLLGIDAAPLPYVGRNLFGTPGEGPVPRPYGEWIDARHLFMTQGTSTQCIDLEGGPAASSSNFALNQDNCREANRSATRAREVSRLVVTSDLQAALAPLTGRHPGAQ